jgi:hypothetical protein
VKVIVKLNLTEKVLNLLSCFAILIILDLNLIIEVDFLNLDPGNLVQALN